MKVNPNSGKPWDEREERLLGTMPDPQLAEKLGRSVHSVEVKRIKMGIAAYTPHRRQWKKSELQLLGKMPDAKLAEKLNCTRKCVLEKRKRLGVAAFSPRNTPRKFRRKRTPVAREVRLD